MNETATITRREYQRIFAAEEPADIAAYDCVAAALAAGREELIPAEFANRRGDQTEQ